MQPKNIYFLIFFLTNIFLISLFSTATAQTPPSEADCRYCHENINPAIKISTIHHDKTDTIIPNPTDAPYGTPGNTFECISCHATRPICGKITYIIETDCVACHATTDLHHTPVPTSCNSCHEVDRPADPHQQGLDCSGCHFDPGGLWYDHTPTPSTCNECHEDTRPAQDPHPATRDCSECHTGIGTTWTEITWDHTPAPNYCASCHEVDRPADPHQQGLDCSFCHFDPGGLWYDHTPAPTSCNACHESTRPADPHPQTRDCAECHLDAGNSWLGAAYDHTPAPTSCAMCHEDTRPASSHPQAKDCTVCHADPGGTWLDHGGVTGPGCQECHGHDADYEFIPGQFSLGAGTFASHSTHTENDADDLKGPHINCDDCHDTNNYPNFKSGTDSNGDGEFSLLETNVCDTCHSQDGNYNGVSSVNDSVGAKDNWATGVYAGSILQSGKEKWCVGCHDDAPANSKVDGSGVSARNAAGDSSTYGFYQTGHGKNTQIDCLQCHSADMSHIDHLYIPVGEISNHTTLTANPTNYRFYAGKGLSLPRYPGEAENFTLCFTCHDDILINNSYGSTNFMLNRSHLSIPNYNLHRKHQWEANCVFCHDPHGTTSPRMTVDERTGTFKLLTLGDDEKYYELADPGLWDDPIENVGGAITTAPDCMNCHRPTTVTAEDHDPPVGLEGLPDDTGWYIRDLLNVSYIVSTDTDIDGVPDAQDNCPCDYNSGQEDADADNIGDACDNSPNDYNPLQEDRDRDGLGDVSDACLDDPDNDMDEDGVCGDIDNCPQTYNPDQVESDTDGLGDACDNCPYVENAGQEDADQDGEGDVCETVCSTFDRIWSVYSGTDRPDELKDLALDGDGNIYAVGHTSGDYAGLNQDPTHSTLDSFVVKFNPSGDILWAKQFGTSERDHMVGITVDTFGKVYVTGYTYGFMGDNEITANQGNTDLFVTQLNASDGALGWSRQVGSTSGPDVGQDVAVDFLGNVYVAGYVSGAVPGMTYYGNMDIIVIKYDAAGNKQWAKQYGTIYADKAFSINVEAGNVYVAGSTQQQMGATHYGSSDCIILQLDPADGTQLLAKQIGTPASDSFTDMVVDGSSIYITGETYGAFPGFTNQGNIDVFVSKLNASDLSPVFINQLGSPGRDYSTGIDVDSSANIYFSGYTDGDWLAPPLQYRDIIILGFNSDGELQRGKQLRVNGWDSGYAIKVDSSGDIYVAGSSTGEIDGVWPSTGYGDFLLLKEANCTGP